MVYTANVFERHEFLDDMLMLTCSVTYCFFMKIVFKIYGSTYHDNDELLNSIGMQGYFSGAIARVFFPIIM